MSSPREFQWFDINNRLEVWDFNLQESYQRSPLPICKSSSDNFELYGGLMATKSAAATAAWCLATNT